jgi:hypothetical protein
MRERRGGDPTTVVADADVLAADLLVGGAARDALDELRRHDWLTLAAGDALLDDCAAVVASLADEGLAAAHRRKLAAVATPVDHPAGDHPGLATAYRADAGHLLSFDERLTSAGFGANVRAYADLSVRTPDAFAALFDAAALYEATFDGPYPGPDRDPRE